MNYKIISDSSADLTDEMKQKLEVELIPFHITVEAREFVDDDKLDVATLIDAMGKSKDPIRTACPSPFDYQSAMEECGECDGIFILTISSHLSGSFNSANTAKQMFLESHPHQKVHILDSKSASSGQTNILIKLRELIDSELEFSEIVEKTETFIEKMETFFILESLDNLLKNGRISKTKGLILQALNIRPIMYAVDGQIELYEINRGFKQSLNKLATAIGTLEKNLESCILVISHVDAIEKAQKFKEKVLELYKFKDIIITPTRGLATAYADNGGIVISF